MLDLHRNKKTRDKAYCHFLARNKTEHRECGLN